MNAATHQAWRVAALWCATGAACVVTGFAAASKLATPQSPSSPSGAFKAPAAPTQAARLSAPVADVLRLIGAGVSEEVVRSYINNSTTIYALSADDILVLNERGVPSGVIVAMLTRSGELRSRLAAAASTAAATAQPGSAAPYAGPTYATAPQTVYATSPTVAAAPYTDYYPYPSYTYSYWNTYWNYPIYSSWWWTPTWGHYPYWRHSYPRYHGDHGWAGYRPPYRWADAYPNKLVAGPNWGADRGANGWAGRRPGAGAGGYPARPVMSPPRGATPAFSSRPVAYTGRLGGGAVPGLRGGGVGGARPAPGGGPGGRR